MIAIVILKNTLLEAGIWIQDLQITSHSNINWKKKVDIVERNELKKYLRRIHLFDSRWKVLPLKRVTCVKSTRTSRDGKALRVSCCRPCAALVLPLCCPGVAPTPRRLEIIQRHSNIRSLLNIFKQMLWVAFQYFDRFLTLFLYFKVK